MSVCSNFFRHAALVLLLMAVVCCHSLAHSLTLDTYSHRITHSILCLAIIQYYVIMFLFGDMHIAFTILLNVIEWNYLMSPHSTLFTTATSTHNLWYALHSLLYSLTLSLYCSHTLSLTRLPGYIFDMGFKVDRS